MVDATRMTTDRSIEELVDDFEAAVKAAAFADADPLGDPGRYHKHMERDEALTDLMRAVNNLRASATASGKPAYLRGQRSIVSAAILLPDGTVLCGVRHLDKHMVGQLKAMGLDRLPTGSVQGFVANDYEFESRESAWLIALRAGQFDPKNATGTQGVLYSEDLW